MRFMAVWFSQLVWGFIFIAGPHGINHRSDIFMRGKHAFLIFITALSLMVTVVTVLRDHLAPENTGESGTLYSRIMSPAKNDTDSNPPRIDDETIRHILYGDHYGGGYLYGVASPCQPAFPEGWGGRKIIAAIETLTRSIPANKVVNQNGEYMMDSSIDGINIRVVINHEENRIVTAYPLVKPRNSCPAP